MRGLIPLTSALKRSTIRRHYNLGQYQQAIDLSLLELHKNRNTNFSKDIIIRGYWNMHAWEELIQFTEQYPAADRKNYRSRAMTKQAEQNWNHKLPPPEIKDRIFVEGSVRENWIQVDDYLWFRYPKGWVKWAMPVDFDLVEVSDSLLELCTELLLCPYEQGMRKITTKQRVPGDRIALSYSAGIDSTAALLLLPEDTILGYHERDFPSKLKHGNAKKTIAFVEEKLKRTVYCIPSNHELISKHYGKSVGFSTDYASGIHLILLADQFNIGYLAFGTVVENTWLDKGVKFRDFKESWHWNYWSKRFAHAGLSLQLPINHLTEACAIRVCQSSPIADVVNSCLRYENNGCGECWKCFHKNGPMGRKINPRSDEITQKLRTRPLRSGMHAIWALKCQNLESLAPEYASLLQSNLDWWESTYPPGLGIISENIRPTIIKNTNGLLAIMEQPYPLEAVEFE